MHSYNLANEKDVEHVLQANEHARNFILKGTTQLDNNGLPIKTVLTHYGKHGIKEVRTAYDNAVSGFAKNEFTNNVYKRLAEHPDYAALARNIKIVLAYETHIATITKYNLGNCEEMATLAF